MHFEVNSSLPQEKPPLPHPSPARGEGLKNPGARDPRLDFFRGVGMFIIFIAHMPNNHWANWIPARFGFSDAADLFVFCSGMASAYAFSRVFETRGWWLGTARVAHRLWQVYWAHVAIFLVIAATMVSADILLAGDGYYVSRLNLAPFFADPMTNLLGLMTLTYVPNYFDILPMYLVVLALVPLMMVLARVHVGLVFAVCIVMWLLAQMRLLDLPAEPWSDRVWFFNPFGWQLVFFTGFALAKGWLPAPPRHTGLMVAAIVFIVVSLPLAWYPIARLTPELFSLSAQSMIYTVKTEYGLLRFIHFLATAYLAWLAVGVGGHRLKGAIVTVMRRVGQQTLAVFLAGMVLSMVGGIVLDLTGQDLLAMVLVNVGGCLLLVAVAYVVGWFKSSPWRNPR